MDTEPDYAALAAVLGLALRAAGIPAGPDRCERLGRALVVMGASTLTELHACALATMVADPSQIEAFERVFAELFYPGMMPRRPPPVVAPQPGMSVDADSAAPRDEAPPDPARSRDVPTIERNVPVPVEADEPGEPGDSEDLAEVPVPTTRTEQARSARSATSDAAATEGAAGADVPVAVGATR